MTNQSNKSTGSTSGNDTVPMQRVLTLVEKFYQSHPEIKESHGWSHVLAVYRHACQATAVHCKPKLTPQQVMEIQVAALLHDLDDSKYFPPKQPQQHLLLHLQDKYPNAHQLLQEAGNFDSSRKNAILKMIQLVSCSENGNSVPNEIQQSQQWHLLIPRWSDRLEAVGARGVIRCYQYNTEHGLPLFLTGISPRPQTQEEVWKLATPERFAHYQTVGPAANDMISHYYDKLLHIARPPPDIVHNSYLEQQAKESSRELVEVCLRYGTTGRVDEDYIKDLMIQHQQQTG